MRKPAVRECSNYSRLLLQDGATLVFYAAIFPRLARNTPHSRALRKRFEDGEITPEEYEVEESLEKNRISNISTVRHGFCFSGASVSKPFPHTSRCIATLGEQGILCPLVTILCLNEPLQT